MIMESVGLPHAKRLVHAKNIRSFWWLGDKERVWQVSYGLILEDEENRPEIQSGSLG